MANYGTYSDVQLAGLLKEGDEGAFTEIYNRYHDFLFVYAVKLTADEDAGMDLVQDIFLNLWARREQITITDTLMKYLHSSVRYGFLNQERSRKTFSKYQESLQRYLDEDRPVTDEAIREKELMRQLEKLALAIPGKMGQIFLLSHFQQYTVAEIAEKMQLSEKSVRNLLKKAENHIRLRVGIALVLVAFLW